MKKILALILALAVFLVVLALVIVPQQGGLIPSTTLRSGELQNTDPAYNETLPIQTVDMGAQGRSIIIAVVMLTHVMFANLHLGGAWVAAVTESISLRFRAADRRYDRTARSITLFNVILFSAGATFAVGGMLFFISLYPVFTSNIFHIYWWPLLAEGILFAIEIFFLYSYWFTWDKISARYHQVLGYGYAVSVFFQTLMINMVAGGMLSPGGTAISFGQAGLLTMDLTTLFNWWFNPTLWPLQFHRVFAAVSFFGFLLAMLAMFHYLDRPEPAAKKYWDWVGSYGLSWGLLGLIVQPLLGIWYMHQIFTFQQVSFVMIMLSGRAWEILLMVGLLSVLFISVIIYVIDRRERILALEENQRINRLFRVFLVVAVIAALILIQPATLSIGVNPLGYMSYKFVALFALILVGALVLGIDVISLGKYQDSEWGNLTSSSRTALLVSGIIGMWIVVVMGYVRESARAPFLINSIIPVPGGSMYPTPLSIGTIFGIWVVITAGTLLIFWFVSRVTAYHPEQAEEI